MADGKLIYPIGFDLESAVKNAGDDWEKKYGKKLEDLIAKRPVTVKLKFDLKKLDDLDAVKKRLKELKIEPITPETKTAIKELARELQALAKALEAVSKYSVKSVGTSAVRGAKVDVYEAKAAAARELARQRAAKTALAEEKLAQARAKAATAALRGADATRRANREYQAQDGYLQRLIKRMTVYASIGAIGTFLTQVREVTAQFELQRVSLGAIIQDQTKANALFSEIKSFALKSPVSILDLTKYTKQLAAYKFQTEELFDWTKRLTDISVGLSVPMERIVLLAGQVRATGFLRGSEIRQATEAGIPLVEALAEKLSKMNGELVTAGQVMEMVSQRAISWELVEDIFKDMTSAGGMFYNMQEKQGNTLYGLWAKLGDAASVMYEEIGNTGPVNSAMKGLIQLTTDLMKNWRAVGTFALTSLVSFGIAKGIKVIQDADKAIADSRVTADAKAIAAKEAYIQAQIAETKATAAGTVAERANAHAKTLAAGATLKAAEAEVAAANATTLWGRTWNKLKAAVIGNWWIAAIAAIAALTTAIINSIEKANRLKNALREIEEESGIEQMKSVRNFESLANVAVKAADGSKKQKDALDELNRTYKDIIPQERLTIENLRAMKGNYDELTQSIRNYIAEQMKQKQINAIVEQTGKTIIDEQRKINKFLSKKGFSDEQIGHFWEEYENLARTTTMTVEELFRKSWSLIGGSEKDIDKLSNLYRRHGGDLLKSNAMLMKITNALREQETQITRVEARWNNNYAALGRYGNEYEKLANRIKENPITAGGSPDIDRDKTPYLYGQQQQNLEILKAIIPTLRKIMADAGVAWQDGWANIVQTVNKAQPQIISSIDFNAINNYLNANINLLTDEQRKAIGKLQEIYYNIGIPDEVVRYNRKLAIDLANDMNDALSKMGNGSKTALDNVSKYFMESGKSVNEYAKRLDDSLKTLKARITELSAVGLLLSPESRKELEDLKTAAEYVEKLRALIAPAVTTESKSVSTTAKGPERDGRVQTLHEMARALKEMLERYKEYRKLVGDTRADKHMAQVYEQELKYLNEMGKQFGLKFDLPKTQKELMEYQTMIYNAMGKINTIVARRDMITLGKEIDSGWVKYLGENIEKKLKELQEKISRTKTAREFYDKILSQTGDIDLAMNVTMSIFGTEGGNIQELLANEIQQYFGEYEVEIPVIAGTDKIDYKRVRELAKEALDAKKIGDDAYNALDKIATNGEKDLAKIAEEGAKLLLKFDEIAQQRVNIEQEASEKIRKLREAEALFLASTASEEEKAAYSKRTNKAVAGVESDRDLNLLKLKDEYLRFFSAIHSLTNKEAETLRTQVRQALFKAFQSGAISADQLKKELKAVDEQFRKLKDDSGMAMDYLKGGFDGLIQRVRDTADELQSVATEISKMESPDQISEGQKSFLDSVLKKFGNKSTGKSFADLFSNANGDTAQMAGNLQNCAEGMEGMADGAASTLAIVDRIITDVARTIEGVAAIRDQLNEMRSDDNQLSGGIWDAFEYLENFNKYASQGWEDLKSGNIVGAVQNTVQSIISIFGTAQAQKVRRLNEEIKSQQEILEGLEYTYSRLKKAADKVFGTDYIRNYKQELKNLEAQASAYQKQAEAEKSKGKKTDKEKLKEYENAYRDTMDEIADMQSELVEKFTGTSKPDAARQMAQSWIGARASLSDTYAAIAGDYKEMIKNMLVEGAAARVIENALTPMWDKMDAMLKDNNIDGAIDSLIGGMDDALNAANNGMEVLWKALEARGYDMKQLIGDTDESYTGIAKSVATATSEEINANTAALNTQNYYLSHVPAVAGDVAAIRMILQGGSATVSGSTGTATTIDYTDLLTAANQHLASLPRMERHLSDIYTLLNRVVTYEKGRFVVSSFLRS